MYLNHQVHIPREATAIHGYTAEFLTVHGQDPIYVYELFRQYAQDCPTVSHNLSFDWNRCLVPEWQRLGIPQITEDNLACLHVEGRCVFEAHISPDIKNRLLMIAWGDEHEFGVSFREVVLGFL
jgi:DNA polymerase III epsilon subunit-like protein